MTSRARPGISKGLLAQLIALVRADEAGSVGDETEMVDIGGIAAAAVAKRVPAALAAGNRETFAASGGGGHAKGAGSRPRSAGVGLWPLRRKAASIWAGCRRINSAGWLAETVAHCRRLVRRRERPFLIGVSGSAVAAG